jgi:polar amino acid transport system substrate-binding protein
MAVVLCLGIFAGCGASDKGGSAASGSGSAAAGDAAPGGDAVVADLQKIQDAGKIVIGITDYAPMNYYDSDGTLIGFDTEYTQAVAEALGVSAEFIEIDWDNKEIELNAGNVDALWNGVTYTAARAKNMDFSKPYVNNDIVVVVRAADADKYKSAADLASARFVAEGGSTGEEALLADETLKDVKFTPVDSLVNSLMEVAAGTADASAVDSTMAYELVGKGAYADLVIVSDLILSREELAIAFRKGSDLTAEVDRITADLVKDGTLQALAEKYGLTLAIK